MKYLNEAILGTVLIAAVFSSEQLWSSVRLNPLRRSHKQKRPRKWLTRLPQTQDSEYSSRTARGVTLRQRDFRRAYRAPSRDICGFEPGSVMRTTRRCAIS